MTGPEQAECSTEQGDRFGEGGRITGPEHDEICSRVDGCELEIQHV